MAAGSRVTCPMPFFGNGFAFARRHGNVSFVECGDGVTVEELRDLKDRTVIYLKDVVTSFGSFVTEFEFLAPDRRPATTAAG